MRWRITATNRPRHTFTQANNLIPELFHVLLSTRARRRRCKPSNDPTWHAARAHAASAAVHAPSSRTPPAAGTTRLWRGGLCGNANPAARNLGNHHGTREIAPFVNPTFEWGAVIATFLSALSIVPRHCARLTHFLHPKLRKVNAVLTPPQLMTLPLRHLPYGAMRVCNRARVPLHSGLPTPLHPIISRRGRGTLPPPRPSP